MNINSGWRDKINSEVCSLLSRVVGIESAMDQLLQGFKMLTNSIESSADRQFENNKTKWPNIFAGGGLLALLLGAFLNGYVRDMQRIEKDVLHLRENRTSLSDPVQDEGIRTLRLAAKSLDETLQREMRLLDEAMIQRITALDARLDKEMNLRSEAELVRIGEISRRIQALERNVFVHTGDVMPK